MKKSILILILIITTHLFADFSKEATVSPKLFQSGGEKQWSPITGQKIAEFYKTTCTAKLTSNGRARQYASINELLMDAKESGIDINSTQVIDVKTQRYIDAKSAYFLLNSTINPTFGVVGTLAFKDKETALKFEKIYGGKIVNFKEALHVAQKNLKNSIYHMTNIYKKKLYPMGERIYKKRCKKIDLSDYIEINELESDISKGKICGDLSDKHTFALALYLWDVKREGGISNNTRKVKVKEDEKCPVCGMFVYKYPRWAAQIFYKHGDHEHHLSFDGVKDMMKFYFNNKKWGRYDFAKRKNISKMLVTDYYTQKAIDARDAYFVVGSDIYGPMGNELIPFSTKQEAQNFKEDHKGKRVLKFNEIKESLPYSLDTK